MLAWQYVKMHKWTVVAFIIQYMVFALVFYLYKLPLGAVGYAALLYFFLMLIPGILRFVTFCRKMERLHELRQEITLSVDTLPEPENSLEEGYQAVLRSLYADRAAFSTELESRYDNLVEYYTVWAHQIKTPIAAMRLLLQSGDVPQNRELSDELQRIEQYVEMVLGYLRLESDSTDYVIRRYSLDEITRRAVRKYASQFIRKKIRLDFQPLTATVLTDEKWLLFVVEQVLSNALKYTRSGTITISQEETATLCIRDTGIGIAPEDLPRVFEQGYTGYNGRRDQKATGIGLYLCRRILSRLGHTITLTSQPGVGTEVRIDLSSATLTVE